MAWRWCSAIITAGHPADACKAVRESERGQGWGPVGFTGHVGGDIAVLVGDDHRYPEAVRLAAIAGAHLVAVCWQPEYRWECDLALVERAAENRVSLAACAPMGCLGSAVMLDPPADSLWNPHRSSPYDGTINTPTTMRAEPTDGLLTATLHPGRALNREVSKDTDLVGGRPWQASAVLSANPPVR